LLSAISSSGGADLKTGKQSRLIPG